MNDKFFLPSTATGLQTEAAIPEQRPDLPGQNVELTRFAIAGRVRGLVAELNRAIGDARTSGLTVSVYQSSWGASASASDDCGVSIREDRQY